MANVGPLVIPDSSLSDEQVLFLADILPSGYQAAINGGVERGSTVAIFGAGPGDGVREGDPIHMGTRPMQLHRNDDPINAATWLHASVLASARNLVRTKRRYAVRWSLAPPAWVRARPSCDRLTRAPDRKRHAKQNQSIRARRRTMETAP